MRKEDREERHPNTENIILNEIEDSSSSSITIIKHIHKTCVLSGMRLLKLFKIQQKQCGFSRCRVQSDAYLYFFVLLKIFFIPLDAYTLAQLSLACVSHAVLESSTAWNDVVKE